MLTLLSLAFAGPPSLEAVGDALATDASKRLGTACVHTPDDTSIKCENGSFTSLNSFLIEYRAADKKGRKSLYSTWLESIIDPTSAFGDADENLVERLRPMVKSRADFLNMSRQVQAMGAASPIPTTPITDTIAMSLAVDSDNAMRFADKDDFKTAGLSHEQAVEQARKNLAKVPFEPAELVPGVFIIATQDGYDSARILLDDRLTELPIQGAPVALVAARDLLFITGADNPEMLDRFLDVALRTTQDDELVKRISIVPIVLRDGAWSDLTLPADHPAHAKLEGIRRLQRGQWYYDQRQSLTALFEAEKDPTLIAMLGGVQLPDGSGRHVVSMEPQTVLLPVADYVGVLHNDEARVIAWDDFLRLAGSDVTPELESFPPLFRADGAALAADIQRFEPVWATIEATFGPPQSPLNQK